MLYEALAGDDHTSQSSAFWWRLTDNLFRRLTWFLLPILLLAGLGMYRAATTTDLYRSSGTLSATSNPLLPEQQVSGVSAQFLESPAAANARIINERLRTDSFINGVADRAGLGDAVESGEVQIDEDENALIINGNLVHVIYANGPEECDYAAYGIKDAIVVDNTGIWREREQLAKHVEAPGASKVILTAPGKGDIPNIVYGVNHHGMIQAGPVLSAASCTTNAIAPVLKAVNDEFEILAGHIESIHSYTNDQNLIDNYHKKERRGRAAPLNMVVTSTGAAKAVAKCLPELAGKLTGNAIRVPTPNVSVVDFVFEAARDTSVEEINAAIRKAADGPLKGILGYTEFKNVSSDFNHDPRSSIFHMDQTKVMDGRMCRILSWYDNEWGFSNRMADTAVAMGKLI